MLSCMFGTINNIFMANRNLRVFSHNKMRARGNKVTVTPLGLTFTAEFIRNYGLAGMQCLQVLEDPEDELFIGLQFFEASENEIPGSYKIVDNETSLSRTCSCRSLINASDTLRSLSKKDKKLERTFELKVYSKKDLIFYIDGLSPQFEVKVSYRDIHGLDDSISGIYSCYDKYNNLVYIGSGKIKQRALARQKAAAEDLDRVQYSVIENRNIAFKWEKHHLDCYKERFGKLPLMNANEGNLVKIEEEENNDS